MDFHATREVIVPASLTSMKKPAGACLGREPQRGFQKRYAIPACFMMAFAVKRDAQFVETVTEMVPFVQVWWDPFCLEKEKPCCLSTAITWL